MASGVRNAVVTLALVSGLLACGPAPVEGKSLGEWVEIAAMASLAERAAPDPQVVVETRTDPLVMDARRIVRAHTAEAMPAVLEVWREFGGMPLPLEREAAAEPIARVLFDMDPDLRMFLMSKLAELEEPSDVVLDALFECLADDDLQVREGAVNILTQYVQEDAGSLGSRAARLADADVYDDGGMSGRVIEALTIAEPAPEEAVPVITAFLEQPGRELQEWEWLALARFFARFGGDAAREALPRLLEGQSEFLSGHGFIGTSPSPYLAEYEDLLRQLGWEG